MPAPEVGGNQPLVVTVTACPAVVIAGQNVFFHVVAQDPDALINGGSLTDYGDEPFQPSQLPQFGPCPVLASPETGAQVPQPGLREQTYTHVYDRPGTYQATFRYSSGEAGNACPGPGSYGSNGAGTAAVQVR